MLASRHWAPRLCAYTRAVRAPGSSCSCRAQPTENGGRGGAGHQPLPHQPRAGVAAAVVGAQRQQQQALPSSLAHHAPWPHQMYGLVKNEEVLPCDLPSGAWLAAAPRGAYTTARTVGGGTSVFELSFHIQRLASSAALMMKVDAEPGSGAGDAAQATGQAAAVADPEQLRPRLMAALQAAVRSYTAASGQAGGELKLTVLVTWAGCRQERGVHQGSADSSSDSHSCGAVLPGSAAGDIYVHVSPLPPRPAPPVCVVVRGAPRQNAAAKDSEWVRQRKALEQGLPPEVNEALLVGSSGALYEGLTSNFFAVLDGVVYTAGEGVLAGTVREVTLAVARREGIPVVLKPPRLADLPCWEGCFITSTSRLLLPVDEASVPAEYAAEAAAAEQTPPGEVPADAGGTAPAAASSHPRPGSRCFPRGGLVARLEQLVLAEVEACSEPLFG